MKAGLISSVLELLESCGFAVVDCSGSRSCFDILAKRGDTIFLVKVLSNIEGFNKTVAQELKSVAAALGAVPVVVGDRMKSHSLEDGVLYDRYRVLVSNAGTLGMLVSGEIPQIHAKRGKYCVSVNKDRLASLRERTGMTQAELAEMLDVSPHSVYRYERFGSMSLDVFERLKSIFAELDALSADLMEVPEHQMNVSLERYLTEVKREVLREFRELGFDAFATNAPFDVLAKCGDPVYTVVSNDWRRIGRRLQIVEEITGLVGGYSVCVSERRVDADSVVLGLKDFREVKSSKDLYRLLKD
ncbi:MAG TPA: helix-turn-helix domain-containing protein [Candidatus Altiarchaeales archaeon]|nr:helix-turn-helix domain-containing protein [Candidatus Altiarchaeales archaeon]